MMRRGVAETIVDVVCGVPAGGASQPGRVVLDTNSFESEHDHWKLVSDVSLLALIQRTGIDLDSRIVLRGQSPLAVARAAWMLWYLGAAEVAVQGAPPLAGARRGIRQEVVATSQHVRALLNDRDTILADVRSRDEFDGRTSGYSYIRARGAIPGALWLRGGPHAHRVEEYTDEGGAFHSIERVARMWNDAGLDPKKRIVFYCGTSWRAAVAFLYAHWLGFERFSLYDGGWGEWSVIHHLSEPGEVDCR